MRIPFALAGAVLPILLLASETPVRRLDGSSITPEQIDDTVTRAMNGAQVTGVAISILNGGKVAYSKAYGFRNKERGLPLTPNSVLAVASFSKSAFAYLVMELVDDQVLDLDKPIQQYLPKPLPEYPRYHDLWGDPRYARITARMLLSHTSGLPNFRSETPNHRLSILCEPGSRYAYSGEGIELLQFVVETVTGKPLQTLMNERVFQPLGMSRSSMLSEARFEDDYASGYDESGRSLGHQYRTFADAAGSMQTTLADFTRFLQAMLDGKGLKPSTRELMFSPQIRITSRHQFPTFEQTATAANDSIRLSYGLGWGLYWSPYGRAFFKEGHDDGARDYTVAFDGPKDGIVIMTNSSNGEGIFQELLEKLEANTFTPVEWEGFRPYDPLHARKAAAVRQQVTINPTLLNRLVGRYSVSPSLLLTVTRKGTHLAVQENRKAPRDLFPESSLRFHSITSDEVVTFEIGSQGRARRLFLHTRGRNYLARRVN